MIFLSFTELSYAQLLALGFDAPVEGPAAPAGATDEQTPLQVPIENATAPPPAPVAQNSRSSIMTIRLLAVAFAFATVASSGITYGGRGET